jgi:hydroxyacylglutathione hydrolase
VPVALGLEAQTNPFLRAADPGMKAALGMAEAGDEAVFAELRSRKDRF